MARFLRSYKHKTVSINQQYTLLKKIKLFVPNKIWLWQSSQSHSAVTKPFLILTSQISLYYLFKLNAGLRRSRLAVETQCEEPWAKWGLMKPQRQRYVASQPISYTAAVQRSRRTAREETVSHSAELTIHKTLYPSFSCYLNSLTLHTNHSPPHFPPHIFSLSVSIWLASSPPFYDVNQPFQCAECVYLIHVISHPA